MKVNINNYSNYSIPMKSRKSRVADMPVGSRLYSENEITNRLEPLTLYKKAKVPSLTLMKGINPNNNDVFDSFSKIDDVSRSINFVQSKSEWNECLLAEIEEFNVARREYEVKPSSENYDHMEEEMGDIFFTAASIAKDSGINPKEAFKSTNRKFYNRINLMEMLCSYSDVKTPSSLKDCKDYERRALWNAAKRKLYDAQAVKYKYDA